MKIFFTRCLLFLLLPVLAAPAYGWGCHGHEAAALIAQKHLTPEAKKLVDALLQVDPGRHLSPVGTCKTTGLDPMAAAATWADAVREPDLDAGWHYIDVPRGADSSATPAVCGAAASCITVALTKQLEILEDTHQDVKVRAAALRYLMHFAGDIHQPLHATDNGDRGGNCVALAFFKSKPRHSSTKPGADPDAYRPNLHGIWDTEMVDDDMKARGTLTAEAFAGALDTEFTAEMAGWQAEGLHFEDWAMDSHEHAEDFAYGELPKLIPIDKHAELHVKTCSENNRVGNRMLHKHLVLGQAYADAVTPVLEERLAMAGIRMAMILNEAAAHQNEKP